MDCDKQSSRVSRTRSRLLGGAVVKLHLLYGRRLRIETEFLVLDGNLDVVIGKL